jgi:hypothetical protein
MRRHFLKLRWIAVLKLPVVLICGVLAMIANADAQIRTVTQQPYRTGGNSVAWITDVPYVTGGGRQQQLDLYIPTQQKDMPLVVFIHGGGWEHGVLLVRRHHLCSGGPSDAARRHDDLGATGSAYVALRGGSCGSCFSCFS